jgi:hypothetical protein
VKSIASLKPLTNLKFLYVSGAPLDDKFSLAPLMGKGLKIVEYSGGKLPRHEDSGIDAMRVVNHAGLVARYRW